MSSHDHAPARAPVLSGTARTIALWVVLLAFFMDILDTTIVNVAIPSIQSGLGASYSAIQWIVAGYALTFALFLITGGRLGDIFGYRTMFMVGMAGFMLASLLSGLAHSTEMLVASRLLQGFTAALMVPQILALIQVMYPTGPERQGVSAVYGAVAGVATVFGPIVGALLVSGDLWGLGWRAIFLVNLPVGVAAILLGWRFLPPARSSHPLRLDLPGVALIVVAMLMLMYPLIQGRELDWPAWALALMAASTIGFALFGWSQVVKERHGTSPLVPPFLFRKRSFVAGVFVIGSFFAIVIGFFLVLTLFLQVGLGYSALKAGLTGIPFSIGVSVAAGLSGPVLVPRFGRSIVTAGPIVMGVGFLIFIWTIEHFGAAVTPWELIPAQLVSGVGMGFVVASVYPFILAEVPIEEAGAASGVINAMGQIGGAVGVALVGVVFFGTIADRAPASVDAVRPALLADLGRAGIPSFAQGQVADAFATCFRDRTAGKDLAAVPESCRASEQGMKELAATSPALAAAVGGAIATHAKEAARLSFTAALTRTLAWLIGAMALVCAVTFFLPRRPREGAEGAPGFA